jgi:hypothetical protein
MRRPLATALIDDNGQPGLRLPFFVFGGRRRGLAACIVVLLALATGLSVTGRARALDAASLKELAQLARIGAPQLALRRMDAEQPRPDQNIAEWMIWEQERLQILSSRAMYAKLVQRVDALPDSADDHFRRIALSLKAEALLQLGETERARASARELLWFHNQSAETVQLENWRRLVVRSYVFDDKTEDARLALLRYRQDFGDQNPQWRWLSGKVLLQGGRADSAYTLLEEDESPQGRFLRLLAQLEISTDNATRVESDAIKLAEAVEQPAMQGALWALAAQAANRANKSREAILNLERALSLPVDRELTRGLIEFNADQLWRRYLELGQAIGNREQRLLGNDEDWYFPATEALEKDPFRARILFAVLAEYGSTDQSRSVAHEYLVSLLDDLPDGGELVQRLYLESDRFKDVGRLPPVIRYRLIDQALESGDLDTASRLMAGLTSPPAGSDRFEWDLRRARVTIFTGDVEAGVSLLQQLLVLQEQEWDAERTDRLLQVVFDLQTVEHHDQALDLFGRLLEKDLPSQQRRELLFWMADSLKALGQHDQAAYLYLKSATLTDPLAMDPWAQTARYRAARELVDAGLLGDARQIYTSLLRATQDASRKAVLQNELQRLHLVRAVAEEND